MGSSGRWQGGKGGKVVRWQGGKGGRMVRQKGGSYLVLFKDRGHKISPRFHLFVSDINQGKKVVDWVQDFLAWDCWNRNIPLFGVNINRKHS